MVSFDKKDIQRFAISTVGAIALSAACVMAAVGPARAGSPAPLTVADWQQNVEKQIDARMRSAQGVLPDWNAGEAVVTVHFTADGDYAGTALKQSSGVGLYDNHALRTAAHIAYPVLPAGVRGAPQDVEMRIAYGDTVQKDRPAQLAKADFVSTIRLAAK